MKPIGVLRFLGTNCDEDILFAYKSLGFKAEYIWWADRFDHRKYAGFILPGGFSYGDYLRCGALAARSPAMLDLAEAAHFGAPVLGICNGFQILCEAGLLPGVLTKNISRQFQEEWVELNSSSSKCLWKGKGSIKLPIAHSMGRFIAQENQLRELKEKNQIWLKYSKNPNGSLEDIAGICNDHGNVAALMPHPERAIMKWMGSDDGRELLTSAFGIV